MPTVEVRVLFALPRERACYERKRSYAESRKVLMYRIKIIIEKLNLPKAEPNSYSPDG